MGTKDWTDTALVECLSDNLPLSNEQRAILVGLVVQRAKQDKDADRYRYLRNRIPAEVIGQVKSAAGCWIDGEDEEGTLVLLTGDDADVAVDAAMLAARGIGAA